MHVVQGTFIDADDVRGTLWYYDYADPSAVPKLLDLQNLPATLPKAIHPVGIALWPPTRTLYVISHQHPSSLLVFTLNPEGTSATFQRQIIHPLLQTPNSVTPISDHEIYFTNDHLFKVSESPFLAKLESYLAYPGGSVVYFDLSTNTGKKVASVPFANGVALLKDNKRIAVGSTTLPAVLVYNIDTSTHELTLNKTLNAWFLVDNVKVDTAGTLLVAGHPWAPGLEEVSSKNWEFDLDGTGEGKLESERPTAGSWVAEWDGNEEGTFRTLYVGMDYGTSSTAVRDVEKGFGLVVGLYEKGIMVWKEK
jgi:arylesterase / paraoxonase